MITIDRALKRSWVFFVRPLVIDPIRERDKPMQINGIAQIHGPQAVNAPHKSASTQAAPQNEAAYGADQLDISDEARLLSLVLESPDVRADKVLQARAAIANGDYETDEKIGIAIDRLLDEIG